MCHCQPSSPTRAGCGFPLPPAPVLTAGGGRCGREVGPPRDKGRVWRKTRFCLGQPLRFGSPPQRPRQYPDVSVTRRRFLLRKDRDLSMLLYYFVSFDMNASVYINYSNIKWSVDISMLL